jgi:hypothetical protein
MFDGLVQPDAAGVVRNAILVAMTAEPPTGTEHDKDGSWVERLSAAAIEAEFETGRHEETVEAARRGVIIRLVRIIAGFSIIAVGIAALPLPGPGWLIIIFGLSLLPFAWAERTVLLIRQKIPGIPDEGTIPLRTWIIMGVLLVLFTGGSVLLGPAISEWLAGLWGDPDRIFG